MQIVLEVVYIDTNRKRTGWYSFWVEKDTEGFNVRTLVQTGPHTSRSAAEKSGEKHRPENTEGK